MDVKIQTGEKGVRTVYKKRTNMSFVFIKLSIEKFNVKRYYTYLSVSYAIAVAQQKEHLASNKRLWVQIASVKVSVM